MGGMKLPVGMTRRALSYDDNLEAPMSTPPHDISINNLWKRPVVPSRKFSQLAEVRVHGTNTSGLVFRFSFYVPRRRRTERPSRRRGRTAPPSRRRRRSRPKPLLSSLILSSPVSSTFVLEERFWFGPVNNMTSWVVK